MSEHRKPNWSWISPLILGFVIGAFAVFYKSSVKSPFDTEKIKRLAEISQSSETRLINVYGTNGRVTSAQVSGAAFRDVLLTLAPVDHGHRMGVMRFPECEILFQTRMDPTVVYVREFTPTSLEFEIDGVLYLGGDGPEFKRRVEKLVGVPLVNHRHPDADAPPESN